MSGSPISSSTEPLPTQYYWSENELLWHGEFLSSLIKDPIPGDDPEQIIPLLERCRRVFKFVRRKNNLYAEFHELSLRQRDRIRTTFQYYTPDIP